MIAFFFVALAGYLLGSIPSGYLAGRIAGVDIRTIGSGNIGATNVLRALGKPYGYCVFAADFSKGLSAVLLAKLIARHLTGAPGPHEMVAAVCCVLGNTFPVWLRFKGGKGVATSAGALLGLAPLATLVAVVVWIITFKTTRYVSVASIAGTIALPLSIFFMTDFAKANESLLFYFSVGLAAVVVLRHRSNLSKLIRGTEPRFDRSED